MIVCKPMNKNPIYETVLSGERKVHRPADWVCSGHSLDVPADMIARQLIWSSRKPDDWEILVYKQNERWEGLLLSVADPSRTCERPFVQFGEAKGRAANTCP